MKKITAFIPNTLTLMNLFCGMMAVTYAFSGDLVMVFWMVMASAVFDFLDGFAARMLGAYSALGADLDSLSDMVSFGVVPGMVVFHLFPAEFAWPWVGFLVTLFSALRLAKFNNDTRQGDEFRGLATPACTMMIVSLGAVYQTMPDSFGWIAQPWFLICLSVALSLLLVSDFVMFALKFKNFSLSGVNMLRYAFLASSLVIVILAGYLSLAIIVLLYILISLVMGAVSKSDDSTKK